MAAWNMAREAVPFRRPLVTVPSGSVDRSADVREFPGGKWDALLFSQVEGRPWDPLGKLSEGEQPVGTNSSGDLPRAQVHVPSELDRVPGVRGVRLGDDLSEKFGYTSGCKKCSNLEKGGHDPTLGHNKTCRERVEKEMLQDEGAKTKVENAGARQSEFLGQRFEEEMERGKMANNHEAAGEDRCAKGENKGHRFLRERNVGRRKKEQIREKKGGSKKRTDEQQAAAAERRNRKYIPRGGLKRKAEEGLAAPPSPGGSAVSYGTDRIRYAGPDMPLQSPEEAEGGWALLPAEDAVAAPDDAIGPEDPVEEGYIQVLMLGEKRQPRNI